MAAHATDAIARGQTEVDLLYRMKRAGWDCLYLPDARTTSAAICQLGFSRQATPAWWAR